MKLFTFLKSNQFEKRSPDSPIKGPLDSSDYTDQKFMNYFRQQEFRYKNHTKNYTQSFDPLRKG